MLAVSPLTITRDEKNQGGMELESFSTDVVDFGDLSEGNLLESINFDDLFSIDGDVLPDLEMFGEFSVSGGEESEMNSSVENGDKVEKDNNRNVATTTVTTTTATLNKEDEDKTSSSCGASGQDFGSNQGGVEIVSKRDESVVVNPSPKDGGKGRKSSAQSKNNNNKPQGKKKAKVDWTPELHRRFVQAVEQLGVDKAVPSRILEIMGIDCLTRHNIASHLQKYRSHRKHLLAREAEAASWSQRRQLYGGGGKREVSPWPAPTMGFPPMTTMHHFRPLHVWGHPSMHMWPKHLPPHSPTPPPPLSWAPAAAPPAPQDPSFWHAQHQRAPNALIPGTPCFPQPLTTTRFGCPPVPGVPPPHALYKADPGIGVPGPRPLLDFHPSKESIDAAIGEVLSKPWLPLPLGLKAAALDSVLSELQRQGIPNIPPSSA